MHTMKDVFIHVCHTNFRCILKYCSDKYMKYDSTSTRLPIRFIFSAHVTEVTSNNSFYTGVLFTMHSGNRFFLGGLWSSKIVISSAASAVLTLVNARAVGCGAGATAPALVHLLSWRAREDIVFCVSKIRTDKFFDWHSGECGGQLVRMPLLTDLSMNTTPCAGQHKSGAAWKEERIDINTCNGTLTYCINKLSLLLKSTLSPQIQLSIRNKTPSQISTT